MVSLQGQKQNIQEAKMNTLYLVGSLIILIALGYPYFLLVFANNDEGVTRIVGYVLSALFTLVLILAIVFYGPGIAKMPELKYLRDKPTHGMTHGMVGYVAGMMVDDESTIDEFINAIKTNPELYRKFKQKIE